MNMRDNDTLIYRLGQLYVVTMHAVGLVVRLLRNYCYVWLEFNIHHIQLQSKYHLDFKIIIINVLRTYDDSILKTFQSIIVSKLDQNKV